MIPIMATVGNGRHVLEKGSIHFLSAGSDWMERVLYWREVRISSCEQCCFGNNPFATRSLPA